MKSNMYHQKNIEAADKIVGLRSARQLIKNKIKQWQVSKYKNYLPEFVVE